MKQIQVLMMDLKSYYPSPAYQLGLLVAYASQEPEIKENICFSFTEHPRQQSAEELAEVILQSDSDLVAASNYAWNYMKLCEVLDLLTHSGAKLPRILLGGPNSAGTFGEELLKRYPILSAIVEAEGEPAFLDICRSLVDSPTKDPFAGARNCVVRAADGSIRRPEANQRIQHLDEVPSPYLTGILPVEPSPIFYETNRGCPYRCSFCYWGNGNSKIYRMSVERIREEMECFARHKVRSFWIADANFGIFKTDAEIAEMMSEINSRHGYPFKHVGVNWAKNSSDRVLDIASIFKRGRMGCTTTMALQSVTPEAEDRSRRYSMVPSKFVNLISSAHERDIDTYTDVIWGLPGESVEEYLEGLDAIISTGVPSILIHQLHLLPGTEFYDDREQFGFEMLSEVGSTVDVNQRSDYWNYIVVSHPRMSRGDMKRGTRIMGISHLLHNHDLGKVVDFYLARYGISHRQVYAFFDDVLLGEVQDPGIRETELLDAIRNDILTFANNVGLDEFMFYRHLSDLVWFRKDSEGRFQSSLPEVRELMHGMYQALCRKHGVCTSPAELQLLSDLVNYNTLISPKPGWKPEPYYTFEYDVHSIWQEMLTQIHGAGDDQPSEHTAKILPGIGDKGKRPKESWRDLSTQVRARLTALLTDDYLQERRGPVTYSVHNPWHFPPSKLTLDWLLGNRSKHCIVQLANTDREQSPLLRVS